MRGVTVFFRQTPAGERVPLARLMAIARSGEFASPLLKGWNAFGSGSMALAAALFFASSRDKPRTCVLLPAYSCPDIVAASLAVGLEPVFVDLADDQTGMDLAALHGRQSADRSICVLVDLFGTQHAMPTRGSLASNSPITLIHDRAQSLAGPGLAEDSSADLVVVSRGRGKPATLLGGGATWARQAEAFTSFSATHFPLGNWSIAGTMLRAALYNLATQPVIFGTAARLPFLHIGETRLRELPAITRLPPTWLVHAARQLRACQSTRAAHCSRTLAMADLIPADGFRIPADALQTAAREGLNRLPVICKDAEQAQWLAGRGRSLGVSSMYGKTLPEFMGMSPADAALAFPVAHRFSRTLVTLPTHLRCGPRTRQSLRKLFHDAR
jgi:hypothetical protein